MICRHGFTVAALIAVMGFSGCASDEASREGCGVGATCATSPAYKPAESTLPASLVDGVNAQEASSAAAVALLDDRFADLLQTNPYRVESVQAASSSAGLVVSVRFDSPLGSETLYPLEACGIETNGSPITGLRWLVQGNRIAAVSPIWGADTACGY